MILKAITHTICTEDITGKYVEIPAEGTLEVTEEVGQDFLNKFGPLIEVVSEVPVEEISPVKEVVSETAKTTETDVAPAIIASADEVDPLQMEDVG